MIIFTFFFLKFIDQFIHLFSESSTRLRIVTRWDRGSGEIFVSISS